MTPTQLAGGFGLPTSTPLSASIEEGYIRRLATLSQDARRLLLVAAADPVGDPALVWRAAERLGIPESAAHTVESEVLAVEKRITIREADAVSFACNAINVGRTIILNKISSRLSGELEKLGFKVIQIELTEFLKAGGAAKCLVMKLSKHTS